MIFKKSYLKLQKEYFTTKTSNLAVNSFLIAPSTFPNFILSFTA